jgi:O-antigen/teichoic acid export membrane protein
MLSNPITSGIGNALAPRAARAFALSQNAGVRSVVIQAVLILGGLMTAFSVFVFLFGEQLLLLFYGSEYVAYGAVIGVLAIHMVIAALVLAVDAGLKAIERPGVNFKASTLGLSVTLVLAVFAIRHFGVMGAALSYLIGSTVGSTVRWITFLRLTKDR